MNIIRGNAYCLLLILIFGSAPLVSQVTNPYQKGYSAEQNLTAIGRVNPYSPGGMGFDNRYLGVVGSPLLFDKFLPALVKVDSEEKYISIESNLDLYENRLIFTHPENGNLMYLPIQIIDEVLITLNEETLVFRTTKGKKFDPVISDIEFYQVLYSNGTTVIKVTSKKLIPADYQRVYSADRRYDEFDTKYTYYYLGPDVLFHKFAPNKKSLLTIFPDKHELINNTLSNREFENKDQMVLEVIKRIASSDPEF